jgi:3-hydroxyacyl-CoA dehydrogenase/3a,7a,12a-trihydroxy-5b-cholest-24-enoyl-CoA hydratase
MLRFDNQVVVITGGARGLGLEYAKFFASRGANLVLNNPGKVDGEFLAVTVSKQLAEEYKTKVVPDTNTVEEGEKIIETAMKNFGRIDVLVNNAGILRDKSFTKMTHEDWDLVLKVHLTGSYRCAIAAWNIFRDQNYGRIINTTSGSGLYGNFGQANYSSAKAGLVGFTKTLAKEGAKYNIKVNVIAPIAATRMTHDIMSPEVLEAVQPKYVVPLVALLCHEKCPVSGKIYEVGGGWISEVKYQRSEGLSLNPEHTPEEILQNWDKIVDFSGKNTYPNDLNESFELMYNNFEKQKKSKTQNNETSTPSKENLSGKWKSEEIYLLMKGVIVAGEAKGASKKCNALYQIDILDKSNGTVVFPFWIDLREGKENAGLGQTEKPDATFVMTDEDFNQMCLGKLNPQMAFIRKKMKINGNFKKASIFTPDLFPKPTPENINKYRGTKPNL